MTLLWRTFCSYFNEEFPPNPKYTADDIPDLTGKTAIVTGGNTGVGREITKVSANGSSTNILASDQNTCSNF